MARKKRKSPTIENAETRASGLESIDAALDLGRNLTLVRYKGLVKEGRDKLNTYNKLLSDADATLNQLEGLESDIADLSDRMLRGVASHYDRNSDEYEQAGGTRKSDIRRSPNKLKAA